MNNTTTLRTRLTASAAALLLMFTAAVVDPVKVLAREPVFRRINGVKWSGDPCKPASSGAGQANNTAATAANNPTNDTKWVSPVQPNTPVTSEFHEAREGYEHKGVDLGAPAGTPVYATNDGVVVASGPASGFGNWVVIRHDIGGGKVVDSVYGHMPANSITAKTGDKVTAGQQIATVGSEGESTGAHLHYEEWEGEQGSGNRLDGTGVERDPKAVGSNNAGASNTSAATQTSATNQGKTSQNCAGSSAAKGGTTDCSALQQNGGDTAKSVWNYLRGSGLSENQAAAVLGNFAYESGDPTFKNATSAVEVGGANAGYGIAQWSFGRQAALRKAAALQGGNPQDLCFQLQYFVEESKARTQRDNPNASEWDGLLQQESLEDAVYYFEYNYERPQPGSTSGRVKYAQGYLQEYGGS